MSDNQENEQPLLPIPVKRPSGLTLICILTFIFSGLMFISSSFDAIYYNYLPEFLKSSSVSTLISGIDGLVEMMKAMMAVDIWYYIFNAILSGISLIGAFLMFRLIKVGFHLYTVAQILLMIVPLIYLPGYKTDIANTAITAIFIFLYYTNLKIMK
jgi:hypothetical protein